jgi:hypothetical protein
MPTGFEDPSIDSGEREQQGSDEELVTFRPVEDEEVEGKDLKDDVKPSLRLSYKGLSLAIKDKLDVDSFPPRQDFQSPHVISCSSSNPTHLRCQRLTDPATHVQLIREACPVLRELKGIHPDR